MISSIAWVPKGAAREIPKVAEPSPEELAAMQEGDMHDDGEHDDDDDDSGSGNASMSDDDLEDGSSEGEGDGVNAAAHARAAAAALLSNSKGKKKSGASVGATGGIEAALRELDMEHYDSEDEGGEGGMGLVTRALNGRLELHKGEDHYLKLGAEDDDSEAEDLRIQPTDLVILAARNEDEVNNLEVWIYEEPDELGGEANVFVHHEILLPNFPLCLAWMDCDPRSTDASEKGNLVAVGTLDPGIEIWDLDTLDAVEPAATLGGFDTTAAAADLTAAAQETDKKKKKKLKDKAKKRGPSYLAGSHQGGVLGLSWNSLFRNVLASAGEDGTVKVWDIVRGVPEHTLTHHQDKVQAVAWNRAEASILLTGSFDKTASLVDVRCAGASPAVWQLPADCEALCWTPHDPTCFLVSCENGMVLSMDARKGQGSAPLWQLSAHDRPTCALSWCPSPAGAGLLATGSTDKVAKLWDVSEGRPSLLASQDLQVGAVFTLGFSADTPYLLGVGGAAGSVSVWDVRAVAGVAAKFPGLLPPQTQTATISE